MMEISVFVRTYTFLIYLVDFYLLDISTLSIKGEKLLMIFLDLIIVLLLFNLIVAYCKKID